MPLTPAQIRRRFDAAEGYLQLGMVDHALTELSAIGNTEDVEYDYHRLLGECFRARQDWAAALAEFEQCNHLQPDTLDILMAMAWCYKRLDRLADAIDTMLSAYETHRNESIVLYNLSCYYSLAGNKPQALSWLGRALRMERRLLDLIPKETDFAPLRNDPEFCRLLELARD
ncbi:MAG TPA: tetratricopeptide repeat protein [Planctomycetaceae bacterium]|nr:tetratricopeptide repeat protein [Planctomycetaceae bacterium]